MNKGPKIRASPPPGRAATSRPMCSCALSRTFPFCDGSQMIAKTNRAGVLVSCGVAPVQPAQAAEAEALA